MYVIRRIARTQPGKEWVVAGLLTKICNAYEAGGRDKAQVYMGRGLPGDQNVVYAEWTQGSIEPNRLPNSAEVRSDRQRRDAKAAYVLRPRVLRARHAGQALRARPGVGPGCNPP